MGGSYGDVAFGIGGAIEEGAAVDGVSQVAFFFEDAQDGADGGVFEGALRGDTFAAGFGGAVGVGSDVVHEELFEGGEGPALV